MDQPESAPHARLSGYDAELRRHTAILHRACDVRPPDHVLDIGCGAGQTTRQAARAAVAGSALGVDVSAPAVERARLLARAEGIGNVTFTRADAQLHPFPRRRFDLALSRFGTMFFVNPVAAFTNIGQALRPAGRLAMLVWQARELNEWHVAVHRALAGPQGHATAGPDPFSLADPPAVRRILGAAGFADIALTDVGEPVCFGPDVAAAFAWVRGFGCTGELLDRLGPAAAAQATDRLRETLAAHLTGDGVWFGARAWLVTARHRRNGGRRVLG